MNVAGLRIRAIERGIIIRRSVTDLARSIGNKMITPLYSEKLAFLDNYKVGFGIFMTIGVLSVSGALIYSIVSPQVNLSDVVWPISVGTFLILVSLIGIRPEQKAQRR